MVRKESKLRPSLSWSDMEALISSIEFTVRSSVTNQKVTAQTVQLAELQKYFESFKPSTSVSGSSVGALLARYGDVSAVQPAPVPVATSINIPIDPEQPATDVLTDPELTNDQRFDILKLRGEHTWSDVEQAFVLNTGTMIMMRRAGIKSVSESDL